MFLMLRFKNDKTFSLSVCPRQGPHLSRTVKIYRAPVWFKKQIFQLAFFINIQRAVISYPDGPRTARYRFIKNAYWDSSVLNSSIFVPAS